MTDSFYEVLSVIQNMYVDLDNPVKCSVCVCVCTYTFIFPTYLVELDKWLIGISMKFRYILFPKLKNRNRPCKYSIF